MSRSFLVALGAASLLLAASPAIAVTQPDPPPTPHCATRAEYAAVRHHQTMQDVVNNLGHVGKVTWHRNIGGIKDQERTFPACRPHVVINVRFSAAAYPKDAAPLEYAKQANYPRPSAAASVSATHCATHSQFKRVKKRMTVTRVKRILGHAGKIESDQRGGGYVDQVRDYPTCGRYASIQVFFSKNPGGVLRETQKSGVFG